MIDISQLAVDTGGSGPPALLIHGFGGTKFTWRHLCRGLADQFSYYAIDLPGYGDSIAPNDFDYTIENLAAVVSEFVVKRGLDNVTLIANSLGGGIALIALLTSGHTFSSRIKSLCIIDGICYPQKFPLFVSALRLPVIGRLVPELLPVRLQVKYVLWYCYYNSKLISNEQIDEYSKPLKRPEVRRALCETARRLDPTQLVSYSERLKSIQMPTLLIWGKDDRVVPVELGRRLRRELPCAQLEIIEDCGHIPQEECPDRVLELIRKFSKSLRLGEEHARNIY